LFIVTYRYKLPPDKIKEYIAIEQKATQIYLEHGCQGVEIYRDSKDPRYWMEINKFLDQKHYDSVIAKVDEDPRIAPLFEELKRLLEKGVIPEKATYLRML
jgi:quinol monooxygenase YgiN